MQEPSRIELEPLLKKQKTESRTEKLTLEHILDIIASFLEKDNSSCTAVCLLKNILIIADNNYGALSKFNATINHQFNVIKYLRHLINLRIKKIEKSNIADLYKIIIATKFNNLYKGQASVAIPDASLNKVIDAIITQPEITVTGVIEKLQFTHYRNAIALIIETYGMFERRSQRIIDFLIQNPESPLLKALEPVNDNAERFLTYSEYGAVSQEDKDWILDKKSTGYKLLLTNNIGTHAELKIIDFLLATRLLTLHAKQTAFTIGISKKCCRSCQFVINIINHIFKEEYASKASIIKTTASHSLMFDNWINNLPIFLFDPNAFGHSYEQGLHYAENFQQIGYIQHNDTGETQAYLDDGKTLDENCSVWLYREARLLKKIRKKFEELFPKLTATKEKSSPMSQSSPEGKISKQALDPTIPNVYVSNINSMVLINELILRVLKDDDYTCFEYLTQAKNKLIESGSLAPDHAKYDLMPEVSRQVSGTFQGKVCQFDIFVTQGDGNCGFYSLPIPFDKAKVVELLHANKTNPAIRAPIATEIIESLKSNYLPKEFLVIHPELAEFKFRDEHAEQMGDTLLRTALDVINPNRDKIPNRQLSYVIDYLSTLAAPTTEQSQHLTILKQFEADQKQDFEKLKAVCQSDVIFASFMKYCFEKPAYRLSFSRASASFEKTGSLLDALLTLIQPPIRLYIWGLKADSENQTEIIYQGGSADATCHHMFHTPGLDTHFELMAESKQSLQTNMQPAITERDSKRKSSMRALFFDQVNTTVDQNSVPTKDISHKNFNS